ncbi:MAG: cysteine desulfurase [Clostridia bacterium]|nr:cysteine desulfurase [Clostridia bacterium]
MDHYLDNAATTRVCPEAAQAALHAMLEEYGNPSSTHTLGRKARALLESSRAAVAQALGAASPSEVLFTSCGSESDNLAILSGAESMKRQGRHILSSLAEHDAVRRSLDLLEAQGYEITRLRPDATGRISPDSVAAALREDTVLVSLMMVNNETGAVTDIAAVSRLLKSAGSRALLHTDAVQAFRKIPFQARSLGADLISVSGHKIHAPKGIGALYIRPGLRLAPRIVGGSQESGLRAGTEPLPQIAAFAAACALDPQTDRIRSLKDLARRLIAEKVPEARFIETEAPHILNLSLPGWRSEVLMNFLESKSVYVSKSSACKQGRRSHVLEAIGLPPRVIDGALRLGFSRMNSEDDVAALAEALAEARGLAHR